MPAANMIGNIKILPTTVHLLIPEESCPFQMQNIFTFSQGSQESHPFTPLAQKSKSHHLNHLKQIWLGILGIMC